MPNRPNIRVSVVYDNNVFDKKLKTDWGFSCFIGGLEKSILFDTGTNGSILLSNMRELGIHPEDIDLVFLSHDHRDHTGGLRALLKENSHLEVWLPEFFPSLFKNAIKEKGATVVEVTGFQEICKGAFTSGVITGWINEQSLLMETRKGLAAVTGCAHPRIVKIISALKESVKKDIDLVLGGFHLAGFDQREIKEIIEQLRALGVKKVGPCHCSGEEARNLFAKEYKEGFIETGAGKEIKGL